MPVHDWKPGFSWLFHDFRTSWLGALARALNGSLAPGHYALIERWNERRIRASGAVTDVPDPSGMNAVTVRRKRDDALVAVCDIAVPDYHTEQLDVLTAARRATAFLLNGTNLLLVNLHRPAPQSRWLNEVLREQLGSAPAPQGEMCLSAASYECRGSIVAHIEPVAVWDVLPDMPLFLVPGGHVLVPLEATYLAAWEGVPVQARKLMSADAS